MVNHYAINLWPCAFLGGVVMFPCLANANYEYILSLPHSERYKHLGAMVVLPASMTEYDNGQGAFSASAFVADITTPSHIPRVTDTLRIDALDGNAQFTPRDAAPSLQDF